MTLFLALLCAIGTISVVVGDDNEGRLPVMPQARQFSLWPPKFTYNATELVDTVMGNVRDQVVTRGWDDINLPDVSLKVFNQSLSIRNQSMVGMGNAYRVGDVVVDVSLFSTKFRSAFAVYNVSSDADVEIHFTNLANYSDGHVHSDCDNVTAYQVFKLSHLTQSLDLDEFQLSVGECRWNVSGLGERAANGSAVLTEIFSKIKDPILKVLSQSLKTLVNTSLQAAKVALLG